MSKRKGASMPDLKVEQSEVDFVMNEVESNLDAGLSLFPGATYEEGVKATIDWLVNGGPSPMQE